LAVNGITFGMRRALKPGMLRITTSQNENGATIQLEGKLAGEWVNEALDSWTKLACTGCNVTLDLTAVTSVDAAGRRLLCEMHARDVRLQGSSLMARGLIEEITS
jgi:ABC-type transporter Mla MlaB component